MTQSAGIGNRITRTVIWIAVAALARAMLLVLAATQGQAQPLTALSAFTCGSGEMNPGFADFFKHSPRASQT